MGCKGLAGVLMVAFLGLVLFFQLPTKHMVSSINASDKKARVYKKQQQEKAKQQNIKHQQQQPDKTDICTLSDAMQQHPLTVDTYFPNHPVTVPHPQIPHSSSTLCQRQHNPLNWPDSPVGSVLCFKAARTGSTFFTKVITQTLRLTERPTSMFWEPYCRHLCDGFTLNPSIEEESLRLLLTQKCGSSEKCQPSTNCRPFSAVHGNRTNDPKTAPIAITALNPRFLNPHMDWNHVFGSSPARTTKKTRSNANETRTVPAHPRIFTLRRTNLVLMAYSKFHHGSLDVVPPKESQFIATQKGENTKKIKLFDLKSLLLIAEHYALGDQELSSSIAMKAAHAAQVEPFVIVYEDVLHNGPAVQSGVLQYLQVQQHLDAIQAQNMFTASSAPQKAHSDPFCSYMDVNCTDLEAGLKDHYPCLYKQLTQSEQGHAWTVPISMDTKSVDIRGDCVPMQPFSQSDDGGPANRPLSDLYQFPH